MAFRLESNNLINKYSHIPTSLQYGFNAGIKYIAHTFTPPNHESISLYNDIFQQTIECEFSTGWYEGSIKSMPRMMECRRAAANRNTGLRDVSPKNSFHVEQRSCLMISQ